MISFEGQFRSKRQPPYVTAKNNYRDPIYDHSKRETTSKELVQKNRDERRKRELLNRELWAATRIQSLVRGFLSRRETGAYTSQLYNQLCAELIAFINQSGSTRSNETFIPNWNTNEFSTCLRAFKFMSNLCGITHADVTSMSHLLLSKNGRETYSLWLNNNSESQLNTLSHIIVNLLKFLRQLPNNSPSEKYVLPVRVLEVFLSSSSSFPADTNLIESDDVRSQALRNMASTLCEHGYFRSVSVFIERQSTLPVRMDESTEHTGSDLPVEFDADEFSRMPKNRVMLDLLRLPFQHFSWNISHQSDIGLSQRFISSALTDALSSSPLDGYVVSMKLSRLIIPSLLKSIPPELLVNHLFNAASRNLETDSRSYGESKRTLRPSITLLHHFVCEILPKIIAGLGVNLETESRQHEMYENMNLDENSRHLSTADDPSDFYWLENKFSSTPNAIPTQDSLAVASLHILAWLFSALLRARCSHAAFSPPFSPIELHQHGEVEISDDEEEVEIPAAAPRSRTTDDFYNHVNDFVDTWPSQTAEVFAGLQTHLPTLALVSLRRKYGLTGAPDDSRYQTSRALATLYYMLAFVRRVSSNSLIPLNSVLSQFSHFLSDLWNFCIAMEGHLAESDDDKWKPKGKLFDLLVSGEVGFSPSKIDCYTAVILTFVDCLRHRLLCLTDLEISGEEDSSASFNFQQIDSTHSSDPVSLNVVGCGFSPTELIHIGRRLRDLMLGLIALVHPARRPTLEELKSLIPGALPRKSLSTDQSINLRAVIDRIHQRAEISHTGPMQNTTISSIRNSEFATMLRWQLQRWSVLFGHIQRLVMLIYDWDRRIRRQVPADRGVLGRSELNYLDSVWLKPDCLPVFSQTKLPRWLRRADGGAVALAKAPFGYYSWLNPDRDEDGSSFDMSYLDWRQMTTLIEMPFVISFWQRVQIFQALVRADREATQNTTTPSFDYVPEEIPNNNNKRAVVVRVRREFLYEDAFEKLSKENEPSLRPKLNLVFFNLANVEEMGVDGGGLSREFITQVIQEGFNPTRGFFLYTDDNTLYPNPNASQITPDYLKHYYFLGRMLAKALYEGMLVEIRFAHFFLAKLVSRTGGGLGFDYLNSLDRELYRQLCMLKQFRGNVRDLELDFTTILSSFGVSKVVELKPGGSSIPVTDENRVEYIHLVANYKLNRQIYPQSKAFISGMTDVVYLEWLRLFDAEELQVLISGADTDIDIDDLRRHTIYPSGLNKPEYRTTVDHFWHILSLFTEQQKRDLLRFATACSRPPMFGFRDLQPPFAIQIVPDTTRLPTSSTCMNLLKLPAYADAELLMERLLYALNANAGFEYS